MFFLELSCFFSDPTNVGNLISGSSAFSKTSLNIWKFTVHVFHSLFPPKSSWWSISWSLGLFSSLEQPGWTCYSRARAHTSSPVTSAEGHQASCQPGDPWIGNLGGLTWPGTAWKPQRGTAHAQRGPTAPAHLHLARHLGWVLFNRLFSCVSFLKIFPPNASLVTFHRPWQVMFWFSEMPDSSLSCLSFNFDLLLDS